MGLIITWGGCALAAAGLATVVLDFFGVSIFLGWGAIGFLAILVGFVLIAVGILKVLLFETRPRD